MHICHATSCSSLLSSSNQQQPAWDVIEENVTPHHTHWVYWSLIQSFVHATNTAVSCCAAQTHTECDRQMKFGLLYTCCGPKMLQAPIYGAGGIVCAGPGQVAWHASLHPHACTPKVGGGTDVYFTKTYHGPTSNCHSINSAEAVPQHCWCVC
jgi:hypothetical protein